MSEHREITARWLARTGQVLIGQMERLKVEDTEALKAGLSTRLSERGSGIIAAELSFLTRGRFVDMGAGRPTSLGTAGRRKPKKWYSPAFYGRLNDLQGALGIQMSEETMAALKKIEDAERG
jgi:hypothetical protein